MKSFRVSDFALCPKLKTRKSRKVFFYFKLWHKLQLKIQKQRKKELSQKFKDYLRCKTIFCHNLTLNLQCTIFFI